MSPHTITSAGVSARAAFATVSVVAVLATGAGPAFAHTDTPSGRPGVAAHTTVMPSQSVRDEQNAAVAASREPLPQASVRVTRVAGGGFDWTDAAIGAGLTAALLLSGAGLSSLRRQHTPATH